MKKLLVFLLLFPLSGYAFETKKMMYKTTLGNTIHVIVDVDCAEHKFSFVKVWRVLNNKEVVSPLSQNEKRWRNVKETYLDVCPKQIISKVDKPKTQKPSNIIQKII